MPLLLVTIQDEHPSTMLGYIQKLKHRQGQKQKGKRQGFKGAGSQLAEL